MVADIYGVTAQAWVVFGVPVGHGCRICTVADIRGAMCYGGCRIIMVANICGDERSGLRVRWAIISSVVQRLIGSGQRWVLTGAVWDVVSHLHGS